MMKPLTKRILITIAALVLLLVIIFGIWGIKLYRTISAFHAMVLPATPVSTAVAKSQSWTPTIDSVGTMTAVQGIQLSPQVSGVVTALHFDSGQTVKQGATLLVLDTNVLQAQLENSIAAMQLAQIDFNRQAKLYEQAAASQSDYDTAKATLAQDKASVDQNQALLDQKIIKAPFSGIVGIRQVSLGQYLNAGDEITTLQQLSPIFVDYSVPQDDIQSLYVGQPVSVTVPSFSKVVFSGKVVAISPEIDAGTRSISVRAELANDNPKARLLPGMFVDVATLLPTQSNVVTIPQEAITYTLYGDLVYVVVPESQAAAKQHPSKQAYTGWIVTQKYVTPGAQKGDDVAILKGLSTGDVVVTAGQIKLQEGSTVSPQNTGS